MAGPHPDPIGPDFQPAPIDAQIKALEGEIAYLDNATRRQVERGTASPTWRAIQMHAMRSALNTLRRVRDGKLVPAEGVHA